MSEEQLNAEPQETKPKTTASEKTQTSAVAAFAASAARPPIRDEADEADEEIRADIDEEEIPSADDTSDDEYEEEEEEEEEDTGPSEFRPRRQDEGRGGRGRYAGRARHRIDGDIRLEDIDYKNIELLSRFIDNRGRILSRRKTRVSAKVQRRVTKAIKRARHLALLPFTAEHVRLYRKR